MTEGELLRQDFTRDVPALSVDDLLRFQLDYPYIQAVRFLYLKKLQHVFPERYVNACMRTSSMRETANLSFIS